MALAASGTLLGFDMMDYNGRDLVKAAADYFYCETDGLYGNDAGGCGTTEFWYRMLPNLLLYQIYDLHSDNKVLRARALRIADRLYEASIAMGGRLDPMTVPDYEHWSFDFEGMEPRDDRSWREPGAAGAFAWMGYMALYTERGRETSRNGRLGHAISFGTARGEESRLRGHAAVRTGDRGANERGNWGGITTCTK